MVELTANKIVCKGKSCIEKLFERAGIEKLIEARPAYRKYLTKDGETLIIKSEHIKNNSVIEGSVLSIEKSGGVGICEGFYEEVCGPILKKIREYGIRVGAHGDVGKEIYGPYIKINNLSIYEKGGIDYSGCYEKPLPRSCFQRHGIRSDFKILKI